MEIAIENGKTIEHKYTLSYNDLMIDDTGIYIQIQDYINCSLLYNNKKQYPIIIYDFISSLKKLYFIYVENGWGVEINYDNPNEIYEFKLLQISDLKNYHLRINPLKQNSITISINKPVSLYSFYHLMKQNINLKTDNIQVGKQDFLQHIDIPIPKNETCEFINIANHLAYNKNNNYFNQNNFLPKNNASLQNIIIKFKSNQLKIDPPKYIQIQFVKIKNSQEILVMQIKNKIMPPNDFKVDYNYGYKYGYIDEENTGENIIIWSNKFEYDSDTYIIEWNLNKEQMNKLKNSFEPQYPFILKCRYASNESLNNKPIWKGWFEYIENVKINIPPVAPSEIIIKERKNVIS